VSRPDPAGPAAPRSAERYPLLYRQARERITALVRTADAQQRGRRVPACPEWTVTDTVAHLAAVAAEAVSGRLTGVPTDEQTAAQVAQRRGRCLDELLAEWERAAAPVEQALAARRVPLELVHDVLTHEADLRGTLGAGRPPEPAWTASLHGMARHLSRLPVGGTLTVLAGAHHITAGRGEPATTVTVDPYELWRALAGRRSRAQMATWQWSGDPAPHLRAIPIFGPTETDLIEPERRV
jgi:uncharacterized protein (TIGR03083 family)